MAGLLGAVLAVVGLRGRPATGFALLVAVVVLLPADLVLPNGVTPLPTLTRLTVLTVGAGLLLRRERVFALTPVHLAAAVFALTTLVTGVLLAPTGVRVRDAALDWVSLVEPLAVFVVALGALRAVQDDRLALRVLGSVTAAAVVLAGLERVTGSSWGQLLGSPTGPLEQRAGELRVRVGAEFALAFAWTLAALLPAAVALARRRGVLAEIAAVAGCLAAAYWSFSRSAPLALAIGLGVLVVANRDRRLAAAASVAAIALLLVAVAVPAVSSRFTVQVDAGAIAVRGERLPVVLGAAAARPLQGVGLSGTTALGVPTTDNSYVRAYVTTGVPGAVALLAAVGCGLACAARGVRGPPGTHRTTSAAALAGAVVLLTAGLVFDALQVRGTANLLWLLLAVGVAASERAVGRQELLSAWRDVPRVRVGLLAAALATGAGLALVWPAHSAVTTRFETLSASRLAGAGNPVGDGRRLISTTCAVADLYAARDDGVLLDCRDLNSSAGSGELRAQAADAERASAALGDVARIVSTQTQVRDLQLTAVGPAQTGRPTLVGTAPVWLPFGMLLLVLLVPSEPLRRLEHRLARPRGGPWGVDGEDVGPRPNGQGGAPARVAQDVDERTGEAVRR